MIEEWTGDNLTEWPYNSQASFDDCDLNADGIIDEYETEKCYDKRCIRSCSAQADVNARTDNWCQCRERSYEVVTEQFAGSDNELDQNEYDQIYDGDEDRVNIDFDQATK